MSFLSYLYCILYFLILLYYTYLKYWFDCIPCLTNSANAVIIESEIVPVPCYLPAVVLQLKLIAIFLLFLFQSWELHFEIRYIRSTPKQNLGGAPYFSSTFTIGACDRQYQNVCMCVCLLRLIDTGFHMVNKADMCLEVVVLPHVEQCLPVNRPSAHPNNTNSFGVPPNCHFVPCLSSSI
jgi:hypothetical protein